MQSLIECRRFIVMLTLGLVLIVSDPGSAGVKRKLLGGKGKDAEKQAQTALGEGRYREALDLYRELLKANPDWNSSRAEAHFSLALLHLSPKTGFRNVELAGKLLRGLERSYPTFQPEIELSSLLSLTEELVATREDLTQSEQQVDLMKKAVATSRTKTVVEVSKRELVADTATLALQERVGKLEEELSQAHMELAKEQAEVTQLQGQLSQKEEALKRVTEALVGGG